MDTLTHILSTLTLLRGSTPRVRDKVKPRGRRTEISDMECFYHAGSAAVGSCRACLKGLCRSCAIELEGGLACPQGCEAQVRALVHSLQ
jgi:hypothetical protein